MSLGWDWIISGAISFNGIVTNSRSHIRGWGIVSSGVFICTSSYNRMSMSIGRSLYCLFTDFFNRPSERSITWVRCRTSIGENEVETQQTAFRKE